MDRQEPASCSFQCEVCAFELWLPIGKLGVSTLGLYDDARFPGRCILVLDQHEEQWEDLDSALLYSFVDDSQRAIAAIKSVTSVVRVNLAVLGNTDSHVHFHLIPRFPETEELPHKSPWNDKRPVSKLAAERASDLVDALRLAVDAGTRR